MLDVVDSPTTRFVQEAERRRIARELHDSVVQSLTALVADLEYFRTRYLSTVENADQEVTARLETWQGLARDSLLSMRQALTKLRGRSDLEFGLEASIQGLLTEMRGLGYTVIDEYEGWSAPLPFAYTTSIYSIVREVLTNIRKHANATSISVFMFRDEDCLHFSIGDNGVGMEAPAFVLTQQQRGCHQGLLGLRERVQLLGGRLSIESAPGKGTRIDVNIPLASDVTHMS